jgi:5'-3' exonuclease
VSKTLLVDGNNLLKIGFHGVKEFYYKGKHVGGVWHFLNTLRKFLEEHNYNKVVVFWDSKTSSSQRRLIYPKYKLNRKSSETESKEESFIEQKQRVKQYLEEMFVRQLETDHAEADDLIAYYCKISSDEDKIIFSSDRDLTQLISDKVTIYSPSTKQYYKNGDTIKINDVEIPHYNIKTVKILTGDSSDNIDGIFYLGEKTLVKLFPELLEEKVEIPYILGRSTNLLKEEKGNVALQNLLSGKTKEGIFGDEFYVINTKLVDLDDPLLSEEEKELVKLYYSESMDPDGRGHRNLIRMMMEDGLFQFLPKNDEAWVYFLKPFLKLTRKEKTKFRNNKK